MKCYCQSVRKKRLRLKRPCHGGNAHTGRSMCTGELAGKGTLSRGSWERLLRAQEQMQGEQISKCLDESEQGLAAQEQEQLTQGDGDGMQHRAKEN